MNYPEVLARNEQDQVRICGRVAIPVHRAIQVMAINFEYSEPDNFHKQGGEADFERI
jgi:hypothetical protein